MLTRGADGRLYRVDPKGAVVVAEEAQNQTSPRMVVRGSADAGASADIYSASADIYSAKM